MILDYDVVRASCAMHGQHPMAPDGSSLKSVVVQRF